MKKVCVLLGIAAPATLAAVMPPAAAHAVTDKASANHEVASTGKTLSNSGKFRVAAAFTHGTVYKGPAPMWSGGNRVIYRAPDYTDVFITCYYSGNTGYGSDPYWDHFAGFSSGGGYYYNGPGHVADHFINFNGRYPWQVGIPHC